MQCPCKTLHKDILYINILSFYIDFLYQYFNELISIIAIYEKYICYILLCYRRWKDEAQLLSISGRELICSEDSKWPYSKLWGYQYLYKSLWGLYSRHNASVVEGKHINVIWIALIWFAIENYLLLSSKMKNILSVKDSYAIAIAVIKYYEFLPQCLLKASKDAVALSSYPRDFLQSGSKRWYNVHIISVALALKISNWLKLNF